jgi:hypothetical protein
MREESRFRHTGCCFFASTRHYRQELPMLGAPASVLTDDTASKATDYLDDLEREVKNAMGNRVRQFHVLRFPGGLILRGQTRSYYAKQMAQQLVMRGCHERILANEIEVV